MRTRRELGLSVSAVLLGLAWPAAAGVAAKPCLALAMGLAVSGAAALAVSAASAGCATPRAAGSGGQWRKSILRSLAPPALVLAGCGLWTWLVAGAAWRLHDFGTPGSGLISIWTGTCPKDVRITLEGLGLRQAASLVVALVTLDAISRPPGGTRARLRAAAASLGTVAGYAALRYGCLVALALELARPSFLWAEPWTTLSWLPLALVVRVPPPYALDPTASSRRGLAASLAWLAAGLALAFAIWFNDPGTMKRGRVLIDESRSDWEWTQEVFDSTSFGIRAEYNYYCLREYAGRVYDVSVSRASLADAMLDSADVLVIKTPTAPYEADEIEAIVRFVWGGGGLMLIGDHTNLFGMSAYLNSIASRFGMRFRFDDTFDLATTGLSTYDRPRLGFHPAVRGLGRFGFLTSCSIEAGPGVEAVMVGRGLGSEDADYGHPNFFGNITYDLADRFGAFLQAGARRYGAGRVLLFTDSTCFSNFCMFSPGKPEAVLGFLDYLNRRGTRYPGARLIALGIAGLFAVAGLGLAPRPPFLVTGLIVLAGLAVGALGVARINALGYGPVPEPRLPVVLFDTCHSQASFFEYLGEHPERSGQQFAEFYISLRRLGFYPCVGAIEGGALDSGASPDAVVIINPALPFSGREVTGLVSYVKQGGRLLLLDSVTNPGSTANQVLDAFGMRTIAVAAETEPEGVRPAIAVAGARSGGRLDYLGIEVFIKACGRGSVTVATDAFALSTAVLGPPLERGQPTAARLRTYSDVFRLLRQTLQSICS